MAETPKKEKHQVTMLFILDVIVGILNRNVKEDLMSYVCVFGFDKGCCQLLVGSSI